jgi:hypothetical protein
MSNLEGSGFNKCNVITINEFRDLHQFFNSSKELLSRSHSSIQRPQDLSAAISDNSSLLPSRLSTLAGYVNYFSKNISWSPEEIKLMYPDWYPGTARNIAEEALSISVDLSLRDESENTSMLNGGPKDVEASAANTHSTFLPHTTHRHTLFNGTTLSLLKMCQMPCPLEILLKTLEMLDILFQLKLDPSLWPSDSFTLAQIHEAKGENDVAETFYRQAIKFFTDLHFVFGDELFKAKHYFGKFLMKINRDEEALLTMLNGYTDWLSGRWPVGTERISLDFWQHFDSDECGEIMKSLQVLHAKINQDGTFACVQASVSRLENLRHSLNIFGVEESLLEFMRLGAAYSEMWMFDAANLVFGFAAPFLERFDSRPHAFERACAYRDYAQHCVRQGSPADQSRQMEFAFHCIQAVYRQGELLDQFNLLIPLDYQPLGPQEAHYELMARKDPALSRWMRGGGLKQSLHSKMVVQGWHLGN